MSAAVHALDKQLGDDKVKVGMTTTYRAIFSPAESYTSCQLHSMPNPPCKNQS